MPVVFLFESKLEFIYIMFVCLLGLGLGVLTVIMTVNAETHCEPPSQL